MLVTQARRSPPPPRYSGEHGEQTRQLPVGDNLADPASKVGMAALLKATLRWKRNRDRSGRGWRCRLHPTVVAVLSPGWSWTFSYASDTNKAQTRSKQYGTVDATPSPSICCTTILYIRTYLSGTAVADAEPTWSPIPSLLFCSMDEEQMGLLHYHACLRDKGNLTRAWLH